MSTPLPPTPHSPTPPSAIPPSSLSAPPAAPRAPGDVWSRLRAVAFWSVVVGIALELVLLGLAAYANRMPANANAFAQVASKITWSSIVCIGISLGLSLVNQRERVMGLLGAVSGPLAFAVARSVHKGTLQAISNAPEVLLAPDVISPFVLAGLKAVEYGVFGFWLGRISKDDNASLGRFVRAGLAIGLVFGAAFLFAFREAKPTADAIEYVSKAVNELVFPVGCALVLFVARKTTGMARRS